MIRSQKFIPKVFYISTLILLPVLMLAIFSHEYRVYDYFFNPDSLYLPSLYQGLFQDEYPLKSFHLNPSMLLFPDVVIYFPLMAITGDVIISSFAFALIQHLLIFWLVLLIFKSLFKTHFMLAGTMANILFMFFFLGAILSKEILFAAFSLVSTNHVGAFVMMLLSLWLLLKYQAKPTLMIAVLLALIVFVSVLSDRLFILMFPVPVVMLVVFLRLVTRKWQSVKIGLVILASTVVSYFFHEYVDGEFLYLATAPQVSVVSKIVPSFQLMMADLWEFATAMDAHLVIILLSLISFILQLVVVFNLVKKKDFSDPLNFYFLFSVVYIAMIFWMPVLTGSYEARHILRYNISAFYLSMINIPVLAVYWLKGKDRLIQKLFKPTLSIGLSVMFFIGFANLSKKGIADFFDYYPDFVKELDEIAEDEVLLNGVAHFWNAKPIMMFSKNGLRVFHSWDNLLPYYHVVGRRQFTGKDEVFNFALISSFSDKEAYLKYFGKKGRLVKNDGTEVLIFPPFKYDPESNKPYFLNE